MAPMFRRERPMQGKITQVIGPVVDVYFEDKLPAIYDALIVMNGDKKVTVEATGSPVQVPVGKAVLGRIFNVLGEPIDDGKPIEDAPRMSIHRPAPPFHELSSEIEILETGIKVIDLLAPYIKGGKIGLFGGAGVGKTVLIQELIHN